VGLFGFAFANLHHVQSQVAGYPRLVPMRYLAGSSLGGCIRGDLAELSACAAPVEISTPFARIDYISVARGLGAAFELFLISGILPMIIWASGTIGWCESQLHGRRRLRPAQFVLALSIIGLAVTGVLQLRWASPPVAHIAAK
jgi:hypothetical protein